MEKLVLAWLYLMISEKDILSNRKNFRQLFGYVLIGVLINVVGYAFYLSPTYLWGSPKSTITAIYFVGALINFFANRSFTFLHEEHHIGIIGIRYPLAQAAVYPLNLFLLLFIDFLDFIHHIIQALGIFLVELFLFAILRFFVFALNPRVTGGVR